MNVTEICGLLREALDKGWLYDKDKDLAQGVLAHGGMYTNRQAEWLSDVLRRIKNKKEEESLLNGEDDSSDRNGSSDPGHDADGEP